jgi:hypothetical protein
MQPRRHAPLALVAIAALGFASRLTAADRVTTDNFVVEAPNKELAQEFGKYAEHYRREKAIEWLGHEMPRWPQRCPLKVNVTMSQAGGATTFTFGSDGGRPSGVLSQEMKIYGELKQLLHSVLPHEITHTVLAHHFGRAVPRWADEGGSVLSENDEERYTHDVRCREILNQGRGIPLRVLFTLKEYPKDMIVVYAQGYSVCQYLIDQDGGRQKFLKFVGEGMKNDNRNWETAVRMYGFENTDELQVAWIEHLRKPPQTIAARRQNREAPTALTGGGGKETRSSAVPGLPQLEPPVLARGMAPDDKATSRARPAAPTPPLPKLLPPEPPGKK